MLRRVTIAAAPFDPEAEIAAFRKALDDSGAIVTFTGQVRPSNGGGSVSTLSLQHYPGMTERGIEAMLDQVAERWPLEAVLVIHRVATWARTIRSCWSRPRARIAAPHSKPPIF